MRELNKENILKNRVDIISQYRILNDLKKKLNTDEFKVYLANRDNIKVVDEEKKYLYFNHDDNNKEMTYQNKLKEKLHDYEI